MAGLAGNLSFSSVVQQERVPRQQGRFPSLERVAAGAIESKAVGVDLWLFVAGATFVRVITRSLHDRQIHVHIRGW